MNPRVQQTLAILFSVLMITTALAPGVFAQPLTDQLGTEDTTGFQPGAPPDQPGNHGSNSSDKSQKSDNANQPSRHNSDSATKTTEQRSPPGKSGNEAETRRRETTDTAERRNAPTETKSNPSAKPTADHSTKTVGKRNADRPTKTVGKSNTDRSNGLSRGLPLSAKANSPVLSSLFASMATTTDDNTSTQETVIDLDANVSALEHRRAALALLRDADLSNGRGDGATGQRQRLVDELNGTFEHVLDEKRVTSAVVFRSDKKVVAPLSQRAPNVTEHVLISDKKLARSAIRDAERVADVLHQRNIMFDESAVSSNISAAKRAYQRADRTKNSPSTVEHYRQAWTHAQRAIDIMDEATEPNVTIETRSDMPHPDSTDRSVTGTVFDVRVYELDGTFSFNDTTRNLTIPDRTKPGVEVRFNTSARLEPQFFNDTRTYALNVSFDDPGIDVANTAAEDDQNDLHEPQTRSELLRLDGDGLPDEYEIEVTGTDPLNPNSNSTRTDVNELDDERVDGGEDFDNESLITYHEYKAGTNPFDSDTDNDNLTDEFERKWPSIDSLNSDSDNDGTSDGQEDPDSDEFVNEREAKHGTSIFMSDTDRDSLNDSVEVDLHRTNPIHSDTDNDSLSDPEEIELGTDPLTADTDGDGVLDGNETYTTRVVNNETGVTVAVRGDGNIAGSTAVTKETNESVGSSRRSHVIKVRSQREFRNATVEIPIADSVDTDQYDDLSVYVWNPASDEPWHPIETTVNSANETATATINSSSYVAVRSKTKWKQATTTKTEVTSSRGNSFETSSDVSCEGLCHVDEGTLVLGKSSSGASSTASSMFLNGSTEAANNQIGILCAAPERGCPSLDPDDDDDDVPDDEDDCPNTYGEKDNGCPKDDDGGGGGGGDDDYDDDDVPDDEDDCPYTYGEKDNGCPLPIHHSYEQSFTFEDGVKNIDFELTLNVDEGSSPSDARLVIVPENGQNESFVLRTWSTTTLEYDFTKFAGQSVTVKIIAEDKASIELEQLRVTRDTDGDSIPDWVEQSSYRLELDRGVGEQREFDLDYQSSDTDGDGLSDNREVTIGTSENPYTGMMVANVFGSQSNPSMENTDELGLDDRKENQKGSNPFVDEKLIVGAQIPTIADEDTGEPKENTYGQYELPVLDIWTPDHNNTGKWKEWDHWAADPPSWIENSDIHWKKSEEYMLVPVEVYMIRNGSSEASYQLPTNYRFSIPELPSRVMLENETGLLNEGHQTQYLILRSDRLGEYGYLGETKIGTINMDVYFPESSPFHRQEDERQNGWSTVKSEEYYYTFDVSDDYDIIDTAFEIFKSGVTFAYGGIPGTSSVMASIYGGGRLAGKVLMYELSKFVVRKGINAIANDKAKTYRADDIKPIKKAPHVPPDGYYVSAGPVIIRHN